MADGGEGTLDAVLSVGGRRLTHKVEGAGGAPIDAAFGISDDGATAVIEAAEIVGLTDAGGLTSTATAARYAGFSASARRSTSCS